MTLAGRVLAVVAILAPAPALGMFAWAECGRYGERCSEAGRYFPGHDSATGLISFVVRDSDANSKIDMWVFLKDDRLHAIEIDNNEDGAVDRRLEFDASGLAHEVQTSEAGALKIEAGGPADR